MNRRFLISLLVLTLLVGIVFAFPAIATGEASAPLGAIKQGTVYNIISPSKLTTTFGVYAGGNPDGKFVDGGDGYCVTDGWYLRSGFSTKTSSDGLIALVMTLDKATTVGGIEIVGHSTVGNDMTDFDVQALVDGEWVEILSVNSNPFTSGKRTKMYTFTPVTATHIRILVNKCEGAECKLGEVSLFETATGNLSTKIDLTDRMVANEQDPKNPVSFAVDGDKSTFLQNFHYPTTLTIDLKNQDDQPIAVDHFALYLARGNNCYPTAFTFYVKKTSNGEFEEIGQYTTNWGDTNGLDSIYGVFNQTYMAYEMQVVMTSGVGGAAYVPELELYQYDRGTDSPGAAPPPPQPTQPATQAPTQGAVITGVADGLTYEVVDGEVTITGCDKNKEGSVDVPGWIGEKRVTKIGDFAFADCNKITNIYVHDNITSIGAAAFINCTYLKTAVLPNGITVIKDSTFHNCQRLKEMPYFTGVTTIEANAFSNCYSLTAFDLPDGVTAIGTAAFAGCYNLKRVNLPESVTTIGAKAFENCDVLSNVGIGNNIKSVGSRAFANCYALNEMQLPSSIKELGESAFENCSNLKKASVGGTISTIGAKTFSGCTSLKSIYIGKHLVSIGANAFTDCSSLAEVSYGGTEGQWRLISHKLGNASLFNAQVSYEVPEESASQPTSYIGKYGDLTYKVAGDHVVISSCLRSASGTLKIPSEIDGYPVTIIGEKAFYLCEKITKITMPDTVTTIEYMAFDACNELTSIVFSNNLTSIGAEAFYSCDKLSAVKLPNSVISIGRSAFGYCQRLSSVSFGDGIKSIGNYVFCDSGKQLTVDIPKSVTSIGEGVFYECDLKAINYAGSYVQWKRISVGIKNENINSAVIYYATTETDCIGEHMWNRITITKAATCAETGVKTYTCTVCSATRTATIAKLAHDYTEATCTTAKTCKSCGETSGSAKGHDYADATCTTAKTCKICGTSSGSAKGHNYADATCTKAKTCKTCGATSGSAKGHNYADATCTKAKTCKTCGATSGKALGHTYKDATCTKAKTCKVCGATSGKKLGHTYTNDCDTSCNRCGATRSITHNYKTTTTKATLSKNGSIVKKCTTCGKVESTKAIKYVKTIKLSKTSFVYNGKVQKPTVTVKDSDGKTLKKGTDYDVTYASGCKKAGTYKVTVKFKGNYSGTKTLTFKINPKAAISTQPKTQKVEAGEKIKFTVKATGTGLKYQWQVSTNGKTWKNCSASAAKKASFSFTSKTSHDGNYYRCKVTDSAGNVVYTKAVRAYVLGIEKQPVKKTVTKNKTAKFTVDASGNGLKYQWQYSTDGGKTWKTCSGSAAKKAAYSFKAKISQNGYYFRCKITDSAKNVIYTSKVKLTVKK